MEKPKEDLLIYPFQLARDLKNLDISSKINAVCEIGVMKQIRPLQTMSLLKLIPISPGEDDTSFYRNNVIFESKPNPTVMQTLMKMAFPFQSNDILPGSKDLPSILLDYPFLKHFDKVNNINNMDKSNVILAMLSYRSLYITS